MLPTRWRLPFATPTTSPPAAGGPPGWRTRSPPALPPGMSWGEAGRDRQAHGHRRFQRRRLGDPRRRRGWLHGFLLGTPAGTAAARRTRKAVSRERVDQYV